MPLPHPSSLKCPDPHPATDIPRLRATPTLRAFRKSSQMSWTLFNQLWMEICCVLNSPSHDILLDSSRSHTAAYALKLSELTLHVLQSGVFAPDTGGKWHYGRHEEEEDGAGCVLLDTVNWTRVLMFDAGSGRSSLR